MSNHNLNWSIWNEKFQLESFSAAELHGLMTGIVCITQAPTTEQWRQILALLKVSRLNDETILFLTEESEDTSQILIDAELDYTPISPDDEQPLAQRVQALSDWCEGFVLGFGLATKKLTENEVEQIKLLQNVADIDFTESDDDEEGEQAYEELYELVRLISFALAMGRPNKLPVQDSPLLTVQDQPINSSSQASEYLKH